ncbi:xylose isomerase-like protein [Fusarium redolens]|uniref:Xylose isomerase-like protein n=1 Tax=Fusarium redolens TaxID=48865 RepID=A0A9P9GMY2_FUSRE|nr:xylose isomerase-like protein [Fusarium redolens]KAH7240847.1 xylose isomerase-like protein [Fusarium redolens]
MHLSSHTWMRPEPLEQTLQRLARLGYASIELAGEPDQFPIDLTHQLLQKYNIKCWGTVTVMHGKRNLLAADPQQRRDTIEYMKQVVNMSAELGGQITTIVPGTVGTIIPSSTPENEWKWAVEGLREVAAFAQEKGIKIGLEPLNRFETYFLNRSNQALALADEVGYGVGVAFDPFHLALEEKDLIAAIHACKSRIIDFHVGDNNRLAPGDGSLDWPKIMKALSEAGYDGGLAVEFMPSIDRTPVGDYGKVQLETGEVDVTPDQLQFIIDHGSGLLSETYYTGLLRRSAETLAPYVEK